MGVRAKFKCVSKDEPYVQGDFQVRLEPVVGGSAENDSFFKYTPSGNIQIGTVNPAAAEQFVVGKEYFVDFSVAE